MSEPEEQVEVSLRDEIIRSRDEVIDRQHADGEVAPETSIEGEPKEGRVRDASGRFTRSEPKEAPEPAVAQQPEKTTPSPQISAPATEQPQKTVEQSTLLAPATWTPAGKAAWATIPEPAKAEILRREQEQNRLATRIDEERQFGRSFTEIANQHKEVIQRAGVSPQRIFADFLGIMNTLANGQPADKLALLRDVATRNGLDFRQVVGVPNSANGQSPPPSLIPQEISTFMKEWRDSKARQEQEAQAREQEEQQRTLDEIIAFRAKPEARFFDAVKDPMVALLTSGAAVTLEEAYEQAIWARPDIRAILQKEQAEAARAEARRTAHVARARQAGGQVRGGAGGTAPTTTDRSLRDELKAQFAEARGRV